MLDDTTREAQPGAVPGVPADGSSGETPAASLADDVAALIQDGKTYLEAELAFQKTRAGYAGQKSKQAIINALAALALLHLALIALVVGLVMTLAPHLTPLGATILVGAVLAAAAAWFGVLALRRVKALGDAFKSDDDG